MIYRSFQDKQLSLLGFGAMRLPTRDGAIDKAQVEALDSACQRHLVRLIEILQPRVLIGVGGYALKQLERAAAALPGKQFTLGTILHPSPASPIANKLWPERPKEQIREILGK